MSKNTKIILPASLILIAVLGVYSALSSPVFAQGVDKVVRLTINAMKPATMAQIGGASKEGEKVADQEKESNVSPVPTSLNAEKVDYKSSAVIDRPEKVKQAPETKTTAPKKAVIPKKISSTVVKPTPVAKPAPATTADTGTYKVVGTRQLYVTAYSSTPDQTDSSPFITASNTRVRDGIIAANFLPFGTKVRFPSLYPNKIFVVEDRMHKRFSERADIWFPTRQEALIFGNKYTQLEILAVK